MNDKDASIKSSAVYSIIFLDVEKVVVSSFISKNRAHKVTVAMSGRLRNLNPYELHKYLVNVYCLNAKGATGQLQRDSSRDRTDLDVIRENHKFLWEDDDVADTWEKQLAKKYYDKLFKEYCICDLTRYKENRVALRWRVEKEVVLGKGQFQCGNKHCSSADGLRSWEVNFAYLEDGDKKNALVKLRLCPECSEKLNYRSKKREVKRLKKRHKKKKKNKEKDDSGEESGEESLEAAEIEMEPSTSTAAENTTVESVNESLWKKGVQEIEEKSREEEFEEYLEDLLL
ncbi:protein FRA10AC1 isoform X2 [Pectinophora gossypiella]|uniref:protein FRA10AC1 isoform X2 n=1 Tax=Pectinophora gossypiella TaxID=13191 RepID=UPI00214E4FD3|nr:protein FRA10AC1 isoform X2 [Pectinophora gossypiella]